AQFVFLHGSFLGLSGSGVYWKVRQKYFAPDRFGWEWLPKPGTLAAIRAYVGRHAYRLRRSEVTTGPQKVYERRYVELPRSIREAYDLIERYFSDGRLRETNWRIVVSVWLAALAGGCHLPEYRHEAKLSELRALLDTELAGEQVVVWCRFRAEGQAIARLLPGSRLILGETPLSQRQSAISAFNAGKTRVLVCQLNTMRYGVNLASAGAAIYYSNSYEYEVRAQSEDRIVSAQKSGPALILDLVARRTVDEDVLAALALKGHSARMLVDFVADRVRERAQSVVDEHRPWLDSDRLGAVVRSLLAAHGNGAPQRDSA
ncbi:MAG TPA: hypothetical protein EYP14_14805, partial [Planctomycetaceae bacterium]|nr:hypothetical protein [Planctomycetaceae bacterium]